MTKYICIYEYLKKQMHILIYNFHAGNAKDVQYKATLECTCLYAITYCSNIIKGIIMIVHCGTVREMNNATVMLRVLRHIVNQ